MQHLFTYCFDPNQTSDIIAPILLHRTEIDKQIEIAAPEWPLDKISRVDLAILRLSVYELTVEKTQPQKVIIDEAVELAKTFGNEHSSQFVNGVLGTIVKTL